MNLLEVNAKIQEWQTDDYHSVVEVFQDKYDNNPKRCPTCGSADLFWEVWEHRQHRRFVETESEYNPFLLNVAYHCYTCGEWWTDEEKQRQTDSTSA